MENQTRFDLNTAIENWRAELAAQSNLTTDDRRELETHLRDLISEFQHGLSNEKSFQLARQRVGPPRQLAGEFEKLMKTSGSNWNRPLTFLAWAIYVVSFFLPSYNRWSGWGCAWMHEVFWQQALHGPSQWLSMHYEFLTFANLLMLASPFLLSRFSGSGNKSKWLRGLTLAAVVLVWSFILVIFLHGSGYDIKIGCYIWATSFVALWLSAVWQPGRAAKRQTA